VFCCAVLLQFDTCTERLDACRYSARVVSAHRDRLKDEVRAAEQDKKQVRGTRGASLLLPTSTRVTTEHTVLFVVVRTQQYNLCNGVTDP
jgi:phosphoribosylcarboxyaminoimidazole (NCAIR) mutase